MISPQLFAFATMLHRIANIGPINDGRVPPEILADMAMHTVIQDLGVHALLTRDAGYHTGGWFRNPDYEQCWHLSLSFFDAETLEPAPHNDMLAAQILQALFGRDYKLCWSEPPASKTGEQLKVWHYRLFHDSNGVPLKPRKEVYTREFTEKGWKSFSELADRG